MSHFISTDLPLQQPILKPLNKRILIPCRESYSLDQRHSESQASKKMMKSIFKVLQAEESNRLRIQNANQMRQSFSKMRKSLCKIKSSVSEVFNSKPQQQKLNVAEIIKMKPVQIDLVRYNRNKISLKMELCHQMEDILREKENYQEWYNHTKNNTANSPIFNKMAFLLQKIGSRSCDNLLAETIIPPICKNYGKSYYRIRRRKHQ